MLAIIAAVAAVGCVDRDPISPSADLLLVHGVLDLGARDQYVLVQRTNGLRAAALDVGGARVTLLLPDGHAISAEQVRDTTVDSFTGQKHISLLYRFSLQHLGVVLQPGGRYGLHVEVPDGRVVTGATTIPTAIAAPDAGSPQPFSLSHDTVRFAWHPVPGARGYALSISSDLGTHTLLSDTAIDFTFETLDMANMGNFQITAIQHVVLSAVDTNYYDYFRSHTDFFTGAGLISHLDGAVGVFGSLVELDARSLRLQ